jgi:hypothetical protein
MAETWKRFISISFPSIPVDTVRSLNNLLTYSMGLASLRLKSVVVLVAGFVTMVVLGLALLVLGVQLAVGLDGFLGLLV